MRTADFHPTRMHPRDACPRKHSVAVELALSEGQHVEPGGTGSERVRLLLRYMDEAVAFGDLVDLPILPRDAGSSEHEKDLLLSAFDVRRRRPLAGVDLDPLEPDAPRAGGRAQISPGAGQMAGFTPDRLHLVPVG